MAHATFEDRLIATGGRPTGFDYLRIILAVAVIWVHSFDIVAGTEVFWHYMHGLFRPIFALILPMFFSLSGFLVAGSLERSRSLISFLGLRVIRLAPALFVEVVFSAVFLGLLFTKWPYRDYFTNSMFAHYFLNILGDIHYRLPGVFLQNPDSGIINQQLWTIPWEMKCYLTIAIISAIGIVGRKKVFLLSVILLNLALFIHQGFLVTRHLHNLDGGTFNGILLVISFLYGIAFYRLRASVIWSKWIALIAAPVLLILTSLPFDVLGDWVAPIIAAYITIYLGLLEPPRSKLISSGDYSYGVYLYGFAVQQAMVATLGAAGLHWYINFTASLALAFLLAVASWHLVEKHAARFRPRLFKAETAILDRYAAIRGTAPKTHAGAGAETTEPPQLADAAGIEPTTS
jgi:peptidoglycan/LPS O-acetylase OafA/YrhL